MSITLRDVRALVNLPPLGDTISPVILVTGAAPKFEKRLTDSYLGMQSFIINPVLNLLTLSVSLSSKFGFVNTFFACPALNLS